MIQSTLDSMSRSIVRLGHPSRILVSESLYAQFLDYMTGWCVVEFPQPALVGRDIYFRGVSVKSSESLEGDEYAIVMGLGEALRRGK